MPAPDGRRARWTEHRRARREDLVAAAVEAARRTGPELAVDDVARSAGVSKTVIYRYFSDKDELIDAVLDRIAHAVLLPRLLGQLAAEHAAEHADERAALRAVIAAFVSIIEDEPQLYRFAYAQAGRSGRADMIADTEREIATALGDHLAVRLAASGRPTGPAMTWAYGIVGMVQLAVHWWADTRQVPPHELVDFLTELGNGGLATLLAPPRTGPPA